MDAKRKHARIVWINLREEAVLEGNEQIYTLREPGYLEELIPVPTTSPQQLEVSSCPLGRCWGRRAFLTIQGGLVSPSQEPSWAVHRLL